MYLAWLDINKSIVLGREIGRLLTLDLIPEVYKKAIMRAKEMLRNDSR